MLQISTLKDRIIPYHHKIISKYINTLNSISPELIHCNPILSGSYAINLVYSPTSEWHDLDFYFSSKEDYLKAFNLLSKIEQPSSTDNADTFTNLNCQLIKKYFLPPQQLIYKHDFVNASVAIQNTKVYTSLDTFKAWSKDELDIRSFQLEETFTKEEVAVKIQQILSRITKYLNRYQFSLSLNSIEILKETKKFIVNNLINDEQIKYLKICKDYYGNEITLVDSLDHWLSIIDQLLCQKNESYSHENNLSFF